MQLNALVICLLTLFSLTSAGIIPLRRVTVPSNILGRSPSENHVLQRRHPRFFVKRQDPSSSPSTVPTLTPTVSQPPATPTAQANSTISIPLPLTSSSPGPSSNSSSVIATTQTSASSSPTTSPSLSSSTSSSPAINSTSQPSEPPVVSNGTRKYVVAHHMVGNTFPYTLPDWSDDIALAFASGIDGFALNMGTDSWQPAQVASAYQAAEQSGLDFKLFISLDMSSFPCASPSDAQTLVNLVNTYVSHPNQLQYENRAFVSTFSGESCQFGQGSVPDGWKSQFTQSPALQGKIYFVPSFFVDPTTFTNFADVMDGDFNWNSGWPIQVTTSFAQSQLSSQSPANQTAGETLLGVVDGAAASALDSNLENNLETAVASILSSMQLALSQFIGATTTDQQHLSGLAALASQPGQSKKAYMGAVSPWFFTHYGPDSYNKNFVYLSDQSLYAKRWESIISSRDQFDIVEVITWNDYGESHYVGPIKGAQPDSQAWTNGMNHTAWLELTQYYATAYKTGQYPTIEKDKIVMWSRPHPANAQSPDPVPQPTSFQILEDAVWAVVMTTAPSTVILTTSPTNSMTFQVPAGVSKLAIPITAGGTMKGVIQRNDETIVELNPTEFTFEGSPPSYNFNAFVASATAE